MAPSYYSAPRSTRDHFVEPPSLLDRLLAGLPSGLAAQMHRLWNNARERQAYNPISTSPHASRIAKGLMEVRNWHPRRLLSLPHLFVAVWLVLLLWGERWVFQSSIEACGWGKWERWVGFLVRSGFETTRLTELYSPRKQRRIIWSSSQILS